MEKPEEVVREVPKDEQIKNLKQQVAALEQNLALYQKDGAVGLYYELNRTINITVKLMREKNLSTLISSDEKGDKQFERVMSMVKNAIGYLTDLDLLRVKLKLTGNEEKDDINSRIDVPFIETVAEKRI